MTTDRVPVSGRPIARALLIAGVVLASALVISWLTPEYLSEAVARRLMGVLLAAVVVLYANAAPKALTPLVHLRLDPVEEQAMRRFAGWSLTLGGLGYAAAWILAPLDSANLLAGLALGASVLLTAGRYFWGMRNLRSS